MLCGATQYGIKLLVDALTRARDGADRAWRAFGLVVGLIAPDSGLWRLAGLVARSAFVGVTGDLRRDIFRYLTGHARGYFAERPGGRRRRIDGLYRRG
jgi:ATP-binding cassette, subfamily B, bacterial